MATTTVAKQDLRHLACVCVLGVVVAAFVVAVVGGDGGGATRKCCDATRTAAS